VAGNGGNRSRLADLAMALLALLVLALVGSWAWARFAPKPGTPPRVAGQVIRVQVLNGSGEAGVATRLAAYLREGGFHVVEVGNADRFDYFPTVVVARTPEPGPAETVARYLGRPPVLLQARRSDAAQVTVIIGRDRSRIRLGS
jgi:hypothetical protein